MTQASENESTHLSGDGKESQMGTWRKQEGHLIEGDIRVCIYQQHDIQAESKQ